MIKLYCSYLEICLNGSNIQSDVSQNCWIEGGKKFTYYEKKVCSDRFPRLLHSAFVEYLIRYWFFKQWFELNGVRTKPGFERESRPK